MLRFQVVTFESESQNITDEAAFRVYHFELDVLGPQTEQTYFLNMNTLPSNASDSCFPGFFHSEPSSRLLVLKVEIPFIAGPVKPCILYVPHDVLLDYIGSHPYKADTIVVPWEAWGPGNTHIFTPHQRDNPNRFTFLGRESVCGMHAMTEPPMVMVQGDRKMLRIMDYHPRRIARNPVTQVTPLRLGGAVDSRDTAAWQKASVSTDKNIPYAFKDIPLPSGLRLENIKCVLGEDVVAVFEVSTKNLSTARYEDAHTDQVFYGYFHHFCSQDREGVLSSHIAPRGDRRPHLHVSSTSEPEAMFQPNTRHGDAHTVLVGSELDRPSISCNYQTSTREHESALNL
jgi:hypothetical protein